MTADPAAIIERRYDHEYTVETLLALSRTPTDVPLGANEIEPSDPKITRYVHNVVRPMVAALGGRDLIVDELNNLVCHFGSGRPSPSLLIMTYTTAQHGNYTDPAMEGRLVDGRAYGVDGDCVIGKGTSQNKGALAATLAALKILTDERIELAGTLTFVVNAEGQSSHRCSVRIIDGHGVRADAGLLAIGIPQIVIGHRGRVDVEVRIRGESGHSSEPHLARNTIWGVMEALERLKALKARLTRRHPYLGAEQLEPYKLVTRPIAPHTLPDEAVLVVDRRLLPDTQPDEAVEEIRLALGEILPYAVEVRKGAYHLPYMASQDLPLVQSLVKACEAIRGAPPRIDYVPYAFDAGYANARGIPTVMFGPAAGLPPTQGRRLLGTEMVPVAEVRDFAQIYAYAMIRLLG
jgi:acetylornithine deacetylase/succinyl-diaminopimelate desuccinylase-like protein